MARPQSNYDHLIGTTFGRLGVISVARKNTYGEPRWFAYCKCECGTQAGDGMKGGYLKIREQLRACNKEAAELGIGIPPALDRIADAVLAHTPKPKTKAQKKRARKAKRA